MNKNPNTDPWVNIPHVSINGPPGAGKTTLLNTLQGMGYKIHIISRYYNRKRRPGERHSREHNFVNGEVFKVLRKAGCFIPGTIRKQEVNGAVFHTAIARRKFWRKPSEGTDLIISFFGRDGIPLKKFIPEMKLVYISSRFPESLIKIKLVERCLKHKISPGPKIVKFDEYRKREFEKFYDIIVFNDGTPEECAHEIIKRTGLPPPRKKSTKTQRL